MATKPAYPLFGVTSIGEKGQIVIPADIRKALKLDKGAKLIAMAPNADGVFLMPEGRFAKMAKVHAAIEKQIQKK